MKAARLLVGTLFVFGAVIVMIVTAGTKTRGSVEFYVGGGIAILLGVLAFATIGSSERPTDNRRERDALQRRRSMWGDLAHDAIFAPVWCARSRGVHGSQRPLWMLFMFLVGAASSLAELVNGFTFPAALFGVASLGGALTTEAWLILRMRKSIGRM